VGTRRAVYFKDDGMSSWAPFNTNLPASTYSTRLVPFYYGGKIRNGTNRGAYEAAFYKNSSPVAIPSVDKAVGTCSSKTFYFKDLSTISSSGASWLWTFPGGSPSSSTSRSPVVTYSNSGSYDVTLKVTNQHGNNTKTITNMVTMAAGCGSASPDAFVGNALRSTGSQGYAEIPAINKNTNKLSVTAWVKLVSNPSGDVSIVHWEDGSSDTGFYVDSSRKLKYKWNGSGSNINSGLQIPLNMWTHVGMVINSNSVQFYLNGRPAYFSSSHSNYNFDGVAQIGSIATNSNASMNGFMDEVRIWEKSLTTDELRLNRHITLDNGNYSGLLAYYQFNESGSQLFDKAGNYNGSLKFNASIVSSTAPLGGGVTVMTIG